MYVRQVCFCYRTCVYLYYILIFLNASDHVVISVITVPYLCASCRYPSIHVSLYIVAALHWRVIFVK